MGVKRWLRRRAALGCCLESACRAEHVLAWRGLPAAASGRTKLVCSASGPEAEWRVSWYPEWRASAEAEVEAALAFMGDAAYARPAERQTLKTRLWMGRRRKI